LLFKMCPFVDTTF